MRIGVVMVTYNRIELLKEALEAFDKQTLLPRYMVVVDNASTDGTGAFLDEWKSEAVLYDRYVIHTRENIGGSGGFGTGLDKSLELDADWVWVSDDDAIPRKDALEKASDFLEKYSRTENISAICGTVINNGMIDTKHRRRYVPSGTKILKLNVDPSEYEKECFLLNGFSYVGTVISKKKMQQVGTTSKDFFIWFDDTDHSLRLSKVGLIYCVPAIRVFHNVERPADGISWKTYYGVRNELVAIGNNFGRGWFTMKYQRHNLRLQMIKQGLIKVKDKKNEIEIYTAAIKDAKANRMGLHKIYRPGWKPEK